MEGDYSRDTFDRFKHFSQVFMQQGRVQLDADWNEQGSILLHYLRTLAVDLIGQHGGPVDDLGFEITPQTRPTPDLNIGPGHYYVDGILCENESATAKIRAAAELIGSDAGVLQSEIEKTKVLAADSSRPINLSSTSFSDSPPSVSLPPHSITSVSSPISYYEQPDYPLDPNNNQDDKLPEGALFVYLDVWVRHITYLEDDSIREVALGGPDTAARAKIVWQVKVIQLEELTHSLKEPPEAKQVTCDSPGLEAVMKALKDLLQPANRGSMAARAQVPEDTETNVCIVSPEASYRGVDNQNYRVEIQRGGGSWDGNGDKNGAATFKWSRDAVAFAIQSLSGQTVTLENLGRDDRFGLEVGDWVEVVDDHYLLLGKAEPLLQVQKIDRIEMRVTLSGAPGYGHDPSKHPLLRRWDQQPGDPALGGLELLSNGTALVIGSGAWLNLEDGVQVRFTPGAKYRTGDYWSIPARTATGDIEWPGPASNRPALPPRGVEHHYAPLAVVFPEVGSGYLVNDLRHSIAPAGSCCPKIKVLNPPTWMKPAKADTPTSIPFEARVRGRNTGLKYNWRIQGGKPVGPDNEASILVAWDGKSTTTSVIAVVVVEGLPGDCPNSAIAACAIVDQPK